MLTTSLMGVSSDSLYFILGMLLAVFIVIIAAYVLWLIWRK